MKMNKYFGTAAFYKSAVMIAVPVMLQQLIQNMVSLIDNFMVAGLSDVKMSGVNIAGQILFVFMVLINTVCLAAGIFMTQFSGARDKKGMQQALCFKIVLGAVALVLYLFVCMVIPRQILSLMVIGNAEAAVILDVAEDYMFLMGFAGLPMCVSAIISSSLREIGTVKPPLVISVIATCLNTFLNWILIYGNLGAPRLEVEGAAYATIAARVAEMLMFIGFVYIKKQPFMIRPRVLLHINWNLFGRIFKKGSMVLFSEMLWVISETVITALYNGRGGADVVSGMASSFAIANLFFISFSGITTATGVLLGKTLGSGDLETAKKQKNWLLSAALVFGVVMGIFGLFTILLVPVVFGNLSASAQSICREMVFYMSCFMPAWVYVNAQFAVSRAGGDTAMGMWDDGIFTLVLSIPGMFAIARFTDMGPVMMYVMVKLVDIPKIIFAHFWLKRGLWIKNLAKNELE